MQLTGRGMPCAGCRAASAQSASSAPTWTPASLQAWKDIERAYGKSVRASFATLSPEPVASASLGQVYRGVLIDALGGGEVAVKVQRPRILAHVALDLYLMRQAAILSRRLPQVSCAGR